MIKITNLITHLNTKTNLTDKVWSRIFYWLPNIEQTETYLVISPVWNNWTSVVEEKVRLEIRVIWWDTTVNYSTLEEITEIVYNIMSEYKEQGVYRCYKSNNFSWLDSKNRKVFILDLIFWQII
jgi:hypothetical protein